MSIRLFVIAFAWITVAIPLSVRAFAISPTEYDLEADRGAVLSASLVVSNTDSTDQTYFLGTAAFAPDASSGTPRFLSSGHDGDGMSSWIQFASPSVTVPANSRSEIPFSVLVPSDAPFGTSYAAVTVSPAPSEVVAANGATIQAKVAALVFLTVRGESDERVALVDFTSTHLGVHATNDVPYSFRVQNQGNVVAVPMATVVVTDWLDRTIVVTDANPERGRVLPGTTRTYTGMISERPEGFLQAAREEWSAFAFGPVTARLVLNGADPEDAPQLHYWVIPWQVGVLALGSVAVLWLAWRAILVTRNRLGSISAGR